MIIKCRTSEINYVLQSQRKPRCAFPAAAYHKTLTITDTDLGTL